MFRHYGSYLFICYLICLILEKCKSISKPEIMRFRFELGWKNLWPIKVPNVFPKCLPFNRFGPVYHDNRNFRLSNRILDKNFWFSKRFLHWDYYSTRPQTQYRVGDHFHRHNSFLDFSLFRNWKNSEMTNPPLNSFSFSTQLMTHRVIHNWSINDSYERKGKRY